MKVEGASQALDGVVVGAMLAALESLDGPSAEARSIGERLLGEIGGEPVHLPEEGAEVEGLSALVRPGFALGPVGVAQHRPVERVVKWHPRNLP